MKNASTFAISRTLLISLFALGGFIFSIAFISTTKETNLFKSFDSRISMFHPDISSDIRIEASTFNCDANLTLEDNKLVDISEFQFSIPISQLKSNDPDFQLVIQQLFSSHNANTVTFNQEKVMVLPTMRVIHMIGNLNIGNITRPVSFQLPYVFTKEHVVHITGKQTIFLSDFGIIVPSDLQDMVKNELVLNVDLKMVSDKLLNPKSNFVSNF